MELNVIKIFKDLEYSWVYAKGFKITKLRKTNNAKEEASAEVIY